MVTSPASFSSGWTKGKTFATYGVLRSGKPLWPYSESQLGFNPEQDGPIVAASTLVSRDGPWKAVWDRFCEAPSRYPHVPQRIRSVEPPKDNLLWYADREGTFEAWPQWNDEQEGLLRNALLDPANKPPHEARAQLLELEAQHSRRRHTVWADIGEAPLALAMEPLSQLARATETGLNAGTIEDVVAGYTRGRMASGRRCLTGHGSSSQPAGY